ncbi:MAG: molybdopterin molybdotransferase MoeA [Chloroflexi bacterium]|nr:molybdopterin molybdotransferase MoeA [Chloroflexota bacterium]
MPMLRVEEALERVLAAIEPLEPVEVPLSEALGLVLAQEVRSTLQIPPLDNSAMDGYAVRAQDIATARPDRPVVLPVIGEVAAGAPPEPPVRPGTAVRIMTGAAIPPGANTVVRFEDTDEEEHRAGGQALSLIAIRVAAQRGTSVRRAGEDVRQGEIVLTKGTALGPAQIGILASLGHAQALVHRRPVIAILASGNELSAPGQVLMPGHIYDINTYTVQALVQELGAIPRPLGIARDTRDSLAQHIEAARGADLLLTSAGVSVGYYDLVKEVLSAYGEMHLWSVRMRPGKPVAFGILRGTPAAPWPHPIPYLGLPGNPVSAMVAFHILARPALRRMMGYATWDVPAVEAVLEEPIHNEDGRRVYARAFVTLRDGTYYARLSGPQGSNILTAMARANGLAICPEEVPELPTGSRVRVELLAEVERAG